MQRRMNSVRQKINKNQQKLKKTFAFKSKLVMRFNYKTNKNELI